MTENKQIEVPQMCKIHQSLLVHQLHFKESDPWRALIVIAQVSLFQMITARDEQIYKKLNGDITRIKELGCLACYRPDIFGEIVDTALKNPHDLGAIKALAESELDKYKRN